MNRRRIVDIFQDVTNPSIPVLFLVGTIVLAVLGNAVYDLLFIVLSPDPDQAVVVRLMLLSGGSLLLLALIVGFLWLWYNARRRPPLKPLKPAQILDRSYAGLVVFVSENPQASEQRAIQHHLRDRTLTHLWLIVSREARGNAQMLTGWLRTESGGDRVQLTQLPLTDAFDIEASHRAVVDALETADAMVDQLIVDITSGTKQMSAGAVLACREYGVPMQYVRTVYEHGRVVRDAPAQLMKVQL
ncbi:DUF1887 family protein [Candidatus Chloroploca sp. M-50]|uniref:DUF1887 family protein n=1 Tax=Candidatus Chloroploca mongolica TaxID=2528176 RepID=A0ABS4D4L8_9CHLR|nr:DUF1887 family protein [Candidatus Chloroploca mongolica]MBP1464358.1 DUF1887 family protein [Candidatus Chloroploca mongolica]